MGNRKLIAIASELKHIEVKSDCCENIFIFISLQVNGIGNTEKKEVQLLRYFILIIIGLGYGKQLFI